MMLHSSPHTQAFPICPEESPPISEDKAGSAHTQCRGVFRTIWTSLNRAFLTAQHNYPLAFAINWSKPITFCFFNSFIEVKLTDSKLYIFKWTTWCVLTQCTQESFTVIKIMNVNPIFPKSPSSCSSLLSSLHHHSPVIPQDPWSVITAWAVYSVILCRRDHTVCSLLWSGFFNHNYFQTHSCSCLYQ